MDAYRFLAIALRYPIIATVELSDIQIPFIDYLFSRTLVLTDPSMTALLDDQPSSYCS